MDTEAAIPEKTQGNRGFLYISRTYVRKPQKLTFFFSNNGTIVRKAASSSFYNVDTF